MFKSLTSSVKNIGTGFVNLFKESKEVYGLTFSKRSSNMILNRQQMELVRTNYESLKKVSLFFVLQLTPIIGYLPIFFALRFPKQVLTYHFWSDEQKDQFLREEFNERYNHSIELLKFIPLKDLSNDTKIDIFKYIDLLFNNKNEIDINNISKSHVKSLAGANSICYSQIGLKFSHNKMLLLWLKNRVNDIVVDDKKLFEEFPINGNVNLTITELRNFSIRRGYDPTKPDFETLLLNYKSWFEVIQYINKILPSCSNDDEKRLYMSMILHVIAINSINSKICF